MFYYQQAFISPCRVCTEEEFLRLTHDGHVKATIDQVRAAYQAGDTEKANDIKKKLPMFMFMAGKVDESIGKEKYNKGKKDTWRSQANTTLNGLYMLDIDGLKDYQATLRASMDLVGVKTLSELCEKLNILFVHVTPKLGLRFVGIADVNRGNLSDNQTWLAKELGVVLDESCKDSSRGSFVPYYTEILYYDNKLLDYENLEYDKAFGELYRSGDSRGNSHRSSNGHISSNSNTGDPNTDIRTGGIQAGGGSRQTPSEDEDISKLLNIDANGVPYYSNGTSYADIQEEYWKQEGGRPTPGIRHTKVLALAYRLRYICENNPKALLRVIDGCGLPEREVADICDAACAAKMAPFTPPRLRSVLKVLAERKGDESGLNEQQDGAGNSFDYQGWWNRLRPLLSEGFIDAVAPLADKIKLAGVLASGAMFGTYLTRCWWRHYDGEDRRLSFLVYVIGDAASGKSFVVNMDRLIMEPMIAADRAGRDWERQYKEDKQQRATSSAAQKKAAQEIKHPVIRYIPSTISNAKLYARLTDAKEDINGEEMHLHLYTCEAELATALRVQQGSWAGKLDLECKSFQNEYAGVDYANEQSVNGIIQVNWNQVISGTPDAMNRKIKPTTILDGLVTRLALFVMPSSNYEMISRKVRVRDFDAEARLRGWGYKLEKLSGEIICPKLVDEAYKWCDEMASQAAINEDIILDYFRKRIPLYMVRYTIVRNVLRDYAYLEKLQEAGKPLKLRINSSDLNFARLIGDFLLTMQIRQYGEMVWHALQNQTKDFQPRERRSMYSDLYEKLPETFDVQKLAEVFGCSKNAAVQHCHRFVKRGFIKRIKKGQFKKIKL